MDLLHHRPLLVAPGETAFFSGALVLGAANNRSDQIKFSVHFRAIALRNSTTAKQHFTSGKSYFERI